MAHRRAHKQSEHDPAVAAAAQIYREHAKHAWTNPDGEKNKTWAGYYIDVIAVSNQNDDRAWVIEIETLCRKRKPRRNGRNMTKRTQACGTWQCRSRPSRKPTD